MGDAVQWLTGSSHTADLAVEFTDVIVFYHFLQSFSRTITTLFHLNGNEHFEARFGIGEGILSLITVCCVVSLKKLDILLKKRPGGLSLWKEAVRRKCWRNQQEVRLQRLIMKLH